MTDAIIPRGVALPGRADPFMDQTLAACLAAAAFAMLPFQNSFLQASPLGGFGAALSVVPLLGFALVRTATAAARPDEVRLPPAFAMGLIYIVAVTVAGLITYDWNFKGVSLVGKSVFAAIQWTFLGIAFLAGASCPRPLAKIALAFAWTINVAGLLALGGLENAGDDNHVMGLSSEPSHFGVVTAILGLALAALIASAKLRWAVLVTTIAILLLSGSKGAIAVLGLVIMVAGIARVRRDRRKLLLIVPVLVVLAGILFAVAISRIQYDIANFSSTVTRLSGVATGFLVARDHPFGVGLGGFYPAFATTVARTWPAIKALLGVNLDFGELLKFAYADDRNLSAKNFLFDTLIYFGWPGAGLALVASVGIMWRCLVNETNEGLWLGMALLFGVLAASTYNTVAPHYVIPMVFGFAWRQVARE